MSRTIICMSEEEPKGFHPDDTRGFSVRLAFASELGDENDDKAAVRAFLEALQGAGGATLQFEAFSVDDAGVLQPINAPQLVSEPTQKPDDFIDWLEHCASSAFKQHKLDFWQARANTPSLFDSSASLDAPRVLIGASSWLAPIPQRLGLAHVLRIKRAVVGDIVFLPYFYSSQLPDPALARIEDGEVKFPYTNAAGVADGCRSTRTPTLSPQATLVDFDSGFVKVREQDQDQQLHRTLARLEQRAGSLFSGLFAVAEVQWPTAITRVQAVRRCSWRAVSTLGACLDTVLLALMMPNRVVDTATPIETAALNSRDGALLGPLLNLLNEQIDSLNLLKRFTRARVRAALRKGIGALLEKPTEVPQRTRNIEKLLSICRPEATPDVPPFAAAGSWLQQLLLGYVEQSPQAWAEAEKSAPTQDLEKVLAVELARLHEAVLGEVGFEATLLRLLEQAAPAISTELGVLYDLPHTHFESAYANALAAYGKLLSSGLNGADAARQSVGALLGDTLTRAVSAADPTLPLTGPALDEAAQALRFWHCRLGLEAPVSGSPSEILLSVLITPIANAKKFFADLGGALPYDGAAIEALERASIGMQSAVLSEVFATATQRFVPDLAPAPLAIPITVDAVIDDEDSPDDFSAAFSGMALLVQRQFLDQDGTPLASSDWSYANLAQIEPTGKDQTLRATNALQALPTTINDGRRSLFLQYDGLPYASSAFDASLPGDSYDPMGRAFFTTDYPEDPAASGFQPLPSLAYGALYRVCAHVLGRSGCLPLSLQGPQWPWQAKAAIDAVDPAYIFERPYSRRTAIGRTTITDAQATARIGVVPAPLRPLLADYPRLGLHSDASLALDLFRRADGSGALVYESDKPFETLYLEDLRYSGAASSELTVTLCGEAQAQQVALKVNASGPDRLCIRLGDARVDREGELVTFTRPAGDAAVWIRLTLKAAKGTTSLSLVDPAVGAGRAPGQVLNADNLLLLGAPFDASRPVWRAPFDQAAETCINFPRVGFADFQRWVANPQLRAKVFKGLNDPDLVQKFLLQLEAANIDRSQDLKLGRLLDALLDPAVDSLRLDVLVLDGLSWPVHLLGQRSELQPVTAQSISVPTLGQMLDSIKNLSSLLAQLRIKELLSLLDDRCRHVLTVKALAPGATQPLGFDTAGKVLSVPAGVSVQLSARPRVHRDLFKGQPSVLHPRLSELAVGEDADWQVFDGPILLIESMPGPLLSNTAPRQAQDWLLDRQGWTKVAEQVISYQPVGTARCYTLQASMIDPKFWHWRQLASVTVTTQRWRFLGRPIYSWINPKAHDSAHDACASREIASNCELLAEFEEEAFRGREDIDASSITVNLLPSPAATTLQQVDWEKPSAALFRHRFTLHGRYAAAMHPAAESQCEAWRERSLEAWRRVVMLAEPSRIALTRPQLRALIPLTQSPDEGAGHTPPLMAILQERPFEFGGLADRLVAEVRSGVGYGFDQPQDPNQSRVLPCDVRQELGPDPRLSYSAYGSDPRQSALLSVEGPIGLTFDSTSGPAPAFANNAQILTPVHPRTQGQGHSMAPLPGLEEHFFNVAMRRYLHPDWVVSQELGQQALAFARPAWIELANLLGSLTLQRGGATLEVVTCALDGAALVVSVDSRVVDLSVSSGTALELARVELPAHLRQQWQVVLLHAPVDERSASLSIFMVPPADSPERRGGGNAPMLLASIDWSLPAAYQPTDLAVAGSNLKVRAISASQTTAMHWARTNRNFAAISIAGADLYQPAPAILAQKLLARNIKQSLHFESRPGPREAAAAVWPRSAQSMQAFPTHTQRHLALLFSETHAELGRAQEKPTGLRMLPGQSLALDAAVLPATARASVRVVEFETPAIILGHSPDVQIPAQHRFGYLDLAAAGFSLLPVDGEQLRISLHLRLVAGSAARSELLSVSVRLRPEPGQDGGGCVLKLTRQAGEELASFGLELGIDHLGKVVESDAWAVDRLGRMQAVLVESSAAVVGDAQTQGLVVEIAEATFADGVRRELWLEAAMLLSTRAKGSTQRHGFAGELDLDWFFGAEPLAVDTASKEEALRQLHEAQARIISVSPPIELQSV